MRHVPAVANTNPNFAVWLEAMDKRKDVVRRVLLEDVCVSSLQSGLAVVVGVRKSGERKSGSIGAACILEERVAHRHTDR